MSVQALTWALEDAGIAQDDGTIADVPAELVSTLVGLANHADQQGRHAYPSASLLAHYARKSERQTRRDLARLEELGLIRRGDQRLVLHIDPDRRPVVWDLAVDVKRPPREAPQPRGGARRNGLTSTSPRSERPDTEGTNGLTPATERGDTHVRGTVQEPPTRTTGVSVSGVRHQGPAAGASEARACELCDDDGTAYVVVDGEEVGVVCTHVSSAANVKRVRARRAAMAAAPKTTPRERELRDHPTHTDPQTPEA